MWFLGARTKDEEIKKGKKVRGIPSFHTKLIKNIQLFIYVDISQYNFKESEGLLLLLLEHYILNPNAQLSKSVKDIEFPYGIEDSVLGNSIFYLMSS